MCPECSSDVFGGRCSECGRPADARDPHGDPPPRTKTALMAGAPKAEASPASSPLPRTSTVRMAGIAGGSNPTRPAPTPRTKTTELAIAAASRVREEDPPPPPMKRVSRLTALLLIAPIVLVLGGYFASAAPVASDERELPARIARANDGTDARRPVLPEGEEGYVDHAGGVGWSDKCFTHIKAARWGWAKAECDEGMTMYPASPEPRATLLYNEALIAKAAGDLAEARRDLVLSLAIHESKRVRAELSGL